MVLMLSREFLSFQTCIDIVLEEQSCCLGFALELYRDGGW